MITREKILNQLKSFHIPEGRPVIVHSSLKAIGEIEGGAETLLSALIEHFARGRGLVCVPTHTWASMVLDLKNPDSCIGVLPKIAAAHPLAVRTLHPTHSISVFGERERVQEFIKNEAYVNSPTSPEGCYGNIYKDDGYVLLIGVNHTKNTFIHCVEEMLEVSDRLTKEKAEATIIHKNGEVEKKYLYWFDESKIPDVSLNFGKFEAAFRYFNCIEDGFIGNAASQLCRARKMKDVLELIYKNAKGEELLYDNLPLREELYKTEGAII